MNILSFENKAIFTGKLEKKKISFLADGEQEAIVYIKPLSFETAVDEIAKASEEDSGSLTVATRIASSVCDEKGNPIFTVQDIMGTSTDKRGAINASLTNALLGAIGEVNYVGKTSQKKTKSGTN